jgi:hypothetical protein
MGNSYASMQAPLSDVCLPNDFFVLIMYVTMSKNYQYVDTFCKMEQSVNMGVCSAVSPCFPRYLCKFMGPPVGGLSGCRQGVFEPLAQGRHACVQKGGEKQPTRIDREMGITQKLVGKLIATLYLLSLSLPPPIWRLGALCTSNSTQGVIQLRAKCRRFGDCC